MAYEITGYNWNGTPIYGLKEVTIKPQPETTNKNNQKLDINNLVNQIPETITSLGGLFNRQQPEPVQNGSWFNNGPQSNMMGGNTMLYIGIAVVLLILFFAFKK